MRDMAAEILIEIVRLLRRGPDRHAVARRLVLRDEPARLDRMCPSRDAATAPRDRRAAASGTRRPHRHTTRGGWRRYSTRDRAAPCARRQAPRLARIGDRGKNIVVDIDQRGRVLRDVAVARPRQARSGLADKRDLARAQRKGPQILRACRPARAGAPCGACAERGRKIVQREHGMHAVERARRRDIDALDQRVRMRAAHEGDVQQIGKPDVVDIAALARQKRGIFEAPEARTDPAVALLRRGRAQFVIARAALATTSLGVA